MTDETPSLQEQIDSINPDFAPVRRVVWTGFQRHEGILLGIASLVGPEHNPQPLSYNGAPWMDEGVARDIAAQVGAIFLPVRA